MVTGSNLPTQFTTPIPDDVEEGSDTVITVLSAFGFLAACGVLAYQCMTISIWDGWNQLF
jgi:hypothetical protein